MFCVKAPAKGAGVSLETLVVARLPGAAMGSASCMLAAYERATFSSCAQRATRAGGMSEKSPSLAPLSRVLTYKRDIQKGNSPFASIYFIPNTG